MSGHPDLLTLAFLLLALLALFAVAWVTARPRRVCRHCGGTGVYEADRGKLGRVWHCSDCDSLFMG